MKMKSFGVLIFVFLSGLCLAGKKTNQKLDNFLSTAYASEVRSLDLYKAITPDIAVEFEEKVKVIGTVKGKAEFQDGKVEGLDKAKRQSDCQTVRKENKGKLIHCEISYDKLMVNYDGKVKFGKLPKVNVKGEAEISGTTYAVEIQTGQKPTLTKFELADKGNATADITGLGPLNRFLDKVKEGFVKQVQATLFEGMTKNLEYAMKRALDKDKWQFTPEGEEQN